MTKNEELSFNTLGLSEKILAILDRQGFKIPTLIQKKSIPIALDGKDLVGVAQTGTGKTLAFGLPLIQRLGSSQGRGLILLPTRELALQVDESLKKIGFSLGLRTAVLIGGENINRQFGDLKRNPHVIIGTPGRINDHLERGSLRVNDVEILVLDEADLMLDMGFAPQIDKIIKNIPKKRQTMLFSATMPVEIIRMAESYMLSPLRIEVAPSGKTAEGIDQEIIILNPADKFDQLEKLLAEYKGSVLIFCRTKHGVRKLTKKIVLSGHKAAEIHSNRSLEQRRHALAGFKNGFYRILVATDIAARGIDVSGIELVLNFDLPDDNADYVHRVGRTARAGKTGKAVSFAAPDQIKEIREIERLINKVIPLIKLVEFKESFPSRQGRPARRFGSRPSGRSFADKYRPAEKSFSKFDSAKPARSFDRPISARSASYSKFEEKKPVRNFGRAAYGRRDSSYSKFGDKKSAESYSSNPSVQREPQYSKFGNKRAPYASVGGHPARRPAYLKFGDKKEPRSYGSGSVAHREPRLLTDKERFRASLRSPEDSAFRGKKNFSRRRP